MKKILSVAIMLAFVVMTSINCASDDFAGADTYTVQCNGQLNFTRTFQPMTVNNYAIAFRVVDESSGGCSCSCSSETPDPEETQIFNRKFTVKLTFSDGTTLYKGVSYDNGRWTTDMMPFIGGPVSVNVTSTRTPQCIACNLKVNMYYWKPNYEEVIYRFILNMP